MILICGMKNSHGYYQQNLCEILRRAASSHRRCCYVKTSLLKNLANLTGKLLCWSMSLLTKLQA